jgi:hypothetical protein
MIVLGYLCYAFGVVDFLGMVFGYDLTGVTWSPIAAVILGSVFLRIGRRSGIQQD